MQTIKQQICSVFIACTTQTPQLQTEHTAEVEGNLTRQTLACVLFLTRTSRYYCRDTKHWTLGKAHWTLGKAHRSSPFNPVEEPWTHKARPLALRANASSSEAPMSRLQRRIWSPNTSWPSNIWPASSCISATLRRSAIDWDFGSVGSLKVWFVLRSRATPHAHTSTLILLKLCTCSGFRTSSLTKGSMRLQRLSETFYWTLCLYPGSRAGDKWSSLVQNVRLVCPSAHNPTARGVIPLNATGPRSFQATEIRHCRSPSYWTFYYKQDLLSSSPAGCYTSESAVWNLKPFFILVSRSRKVAAGI